MNGKVRGFAFVLDSIDVSAKLPYEIIPNHLFRKASDQEIESIKRQLSAYQYSEVRYEHEIIKLDETSFQSKPLPSEKWRYYVIFFDESSLKLRNIEYASCLIENDITLGWKFFKHEGISGAVGYNISMLATHFADQHAEFTLAKRLGNDDLNEISSNYNLITGLDETRNQNVSKAILNFYQTKIIPESSSLKTLSYFSIVECLLTHPPLPSDRTDSITRQITSKMSLLNKRFQRQIEYKSFFPGVADISSAWRLLYGYRSSLAHGGNPDFVKDFVSLVNTDKIRLFLKENLKLLILYSLKEPEFIADLQKC